MVFPPAFFRYSAPFFRSEHLYYNNECSFRQAISLLLTFHVIPLSAPAPPSVASTCLNVPERSIKFTLFSVYPRYPLPESACHPPAQPAPLCIIRLFHPSFCRDICAALFPSIRHKNVISPSQFRAQSSFSFRSSSSFIFSLSSIFRSVSLAVSRSPPRIRSEPRTVKTVPPSPSAASEDVFWIHDAEDL